MRYKSYLPYVGESWLWPLSEALAIFHESLAPQLLKRKLELAEEGRKLFPDDSLVFRAFRECPFHQLQIVVIGQRPYGRENQITGLAYDAPKQLGEIPNSLRNILNEITHVKGKESEGMRSEYSSYLEHLPPQGVLLWNLALTSEEDDAGAHVNLWQPFAKAVVDVLNKKPSLLWVLWGKDVRSWAEPLISPRHKVLASDGHPNPFSAKEWRGEFEKISKTPQGKKIHW